MKVYIILGVILVAVGAGWLQAERARAREAGRVEVLLAQRDSALEVLDTSRDQAQATVDSLTRMVRVADSARRSFASSRPRIDSVFTLITDTVVRALVDTLRMECDACADALALSEARSAELDTAWAFERREHNATRALLTRIRGQRPSRFGFGLTAGAGILYDGQIRAGPAVVAGFTVRF